MAEPRSVAGHHVDGEAPPERGWVAPEVADEFPGVGIYWSVVETRSGRSPRQVKRWLAKLPAGV